MMSIERFCDLLVPYKPVLRCVKGKKLELKLKLKKYKIIAYTKEEKRITKRVIKNNSILKRHGT